AASTTNGQDGAFRFDAVPVGSYRVVVDTTPIRDSLRGARIDTAHDHVAAHGRAAVRRADSYRNVPIPEAHNRTVGPTVFIEGIVLNALAAFADSSIYVVDRSAAIRVVRIPHSEAVPGDSVRVLGTIGTRDGQPVIS